MPTEQIAVYVQLALLNSDGALRKMVKNGPLAIQAICIASPSNGCHKSILNKQINSALWRHSRNKWRVTSENPDIAIMHIGSEGLANKRRELSNLYIGGFNDSDDLDCQLFYSIQENVIKNVVIVVSLDSPELKQRFCLASQILQGLGLALPNGRSFSKIWNNPTDGLYEFNEEFVSRVTKSFGILEYIHSCPAIKPGMTAPGIRRVLVGASTCLTGLDFTLEKSNN